MAFFVYGCGNSTPLSRRFAFRVVRWLSGERTGAPKNLKAVPVCELLKIKKTGFTMSSMVSA